MILFNHMQKKIRLTTVKLCNSTKHIKILPQGWEIRRFITAFTTARHLSSPRPSTPQITFLKTHLNPIRPRMLKFLSLGVTTGFLPRSIWKLRSAFPRFYPTRNLCTTPFRHWQLYGELVRNLVAHGDARKGKWRGNWRMEWVASTLTPPPKVVYPALLKLMRTPRLPAVDWTDAPTNFNGLVRFGERRNLVSARVPSRSARAIHLLQWLTTYHHPAVSTFNTCTYIFNKHRALSLSKLHL